MTYANAISTPWSTSYFGFRKNNVFIIEHEVLTAVAYVVMLVLALLVKT